MDNIVQVAVNSGKFPTLVKAVQAAGLVDALSAPGQYTVFAPSEEAFRAVPKSTLDSLMADKERLGSVLKYHVINGKYMSKDVLTGIKSSGTLEIPTLHGDKVRLTETGSTKRSLKIDDANIVTSDIQASNGVIHVIDKVIMPKKLKQHA